MTVPLSPRVLAETIVGGGPYHDDDAEAVARAYLELLAERPEGREGMVTVYDSDDHYLGCMGRETWAAMLAKESA